MLGLSLILVDCADMLRTTVEVKTTDRLPVVVVHEYTGVAARASERDTMRLNRVAQDTLHEWKLSISSLVVTIESSSLNPPFAISSTMYLIRSVT